MPTTWSAASDDAGVYIERDTTGVVIARMLDRATPEEINLMAAAPAMYDALVKVVGFMDRLAEQSDQQSKTNERFPALHEATVADAKNWRATAASLRKALPKEASK